LLIRNPVSEFDLNARSWLPGVKGGAREEDGNEVEDDEPAHSLTG
jgi:hypothetical protein